MRTVMLGVGTTNQHVDSFIDYLARLTLLLCRQNTNFEGGPAGTRIFGVLKHTVTLYGSFEVYWRKLSKSTAGLRPNR
jgi:hypothetical protein